MRYWLMLAIVAFPGVCVAQTRVAAYEALDLPPANQAVTFVKQAAERGDRVDQALQVELQLESTVRKGGQEVEKSSSAMGRHQVRTVIAEQVIDGRTMAARVRFAACTRKIDNKTSEPPVVGKTYVCRRLEDDTLSVTREDGSIASPDEFSIVSESMESLGRPNPLADYLAGKTVTVGETLEVPGEVGAALLGSKAAMGKVSKFTLLLRELAPDASVATFAVEIESVGTNKTQMRLMVAGELDIEPASCRTRRMAIAGPLGMATTTGSYSTAQTTYVRGKLKLDMRADYN